MHFEFQFQLQYLVRMSHFLEVSPCRPSQEREVQCHAAERQHALGIWDEWRSRREYKVGTYMFVCMKYITWKGSNHQGALGQAAHSACVTGASLLCNLNIQHGHVKSEQHKSRISNIHLQNSGASGDLQAAGRRDTHHHSEL